MEFQNHLVFWILFCIFLLISDTMYMACWLINSYVVASEVKQEIRRNVAAIL